MFFPSTVSFFRSLVHSRCPWGGVAHAGLDSDLPEVQKPPKTSKTKEKHTQTKFKNIKHTNRLF